MDAISKFHMARRRLGDLVDAFRHDEEGATAIEYGLIVALVFLATVAAIRSFTESASEMYDTIDQTLESAGS